MLYKSKPMYAVLLYIFNWNNSYDHFALFENKWANLESLRLDQRTFQTGTNLNLVIKCVSFFFGYDYEALHQKEEAFLFQSHYHAYE